jgi:hypothetical protein
MSFDSWFEQHTLTQDIFDDTNPTDSTTLLASFSNIWNFTETPTFSNSESLLNNVSSPLIFFNNPINTLYGEGIDCIDKYVDSDDNIVYKLKKSVTIINLQLPHTETDESQYMVLNSSEIFDGSGHTITISGEELPGIFNHATFEDDINNFSHSYDGDRRGFLVRNLRIIPNTKLLTEHGVIIASNRYGARNINYNFTIRNCIIEKGNSTVDSGENCGAFVGYDDFCGRNDIESAILIENCVSYFSEESWNNASALGKQIGIKENDNVTMKNSILVCNDNTKSAQFFNYNTAVVKHPTIINCYIFDSSYNEIIIGFNHQTQEIIQTENRLMFGNEVTPNIIIEYNDNENLIPNFNSGVWKEVYFMALCIPSFDEISGECRGIFKSSNIYPNSITGLPYNKEIIRLIEQFSKKIYNDTLTIQWVTQGPFEKYKIEILSNNLLFYVVESNILDTNIAQKKAPQHSKILSYRWKVPEIWYLYDSEFQIKISNFSDSSDYILSPLFRIEKPPPIPDTRNNINHFPVGKLETVMDSKYDHKPIFIKKGKKALVSKYSKVTENSPKDKINVPRKTLSYIEYIKKKVAKESTKIER